MPRAAAPLLELLEGVSLSLEEEEAEHKVSHKDHDQADDHCAGGALTHTLGATSGGEAPRTTDLQQQGTQRGGGRTDAVQYTQPRNGVMALGRLVV